MNFATAAQETCYNTTRQQLRELFGNAAVTHVDEPLIYVARGSSVTQVAVLPAPWNEETAIICVRAVVVADVEIVDDLMGFLLRKNDGMCFGAFGLDAKNNVCFEHTIVGAPYSAETLRASVLAVSSTAEQYDGLIIARWGGRPAITEEPLP
ncbi:MAG: YbjN domain-containing protein [Nitrospiraceae bacterium]|nr:YbjN domain-containing protein [Nitrospiraceae bacterium]